MNLVSLTENLTATESDAVVALTLAVANLRRLGIVATVELDPLQPPAMGHYTPDRLRAFLHDVARGALTRRGYRTFTLMWMGRTTDRARKAEVGESVAAGLITWGGKTGPNVVATLTDKGREVLK